MRQRESSAWLGDLRALGGGQSDRRTYKQTYGFLLFYRTSSPGRYENVSFSVTLTKMSFLIHDLSLMSARLDVSTKMSLFMITTEFYLFTLS